MPQVKKAEVDLRIRQAALERFAHDGYDQTSMASIARAAGMATANIYRYYPDGKQRLFDTVVTDEVADTHEGLITDRVRALVLPLDAADADDVTAERLLDFWVTHRYEVVILLGRAGGTRFEGYGERFVRLLIDLGLERLRAGGTEPSEAVHHLLAIVFDNTRRALVAILSAHDQADAIRHAVEGFWSYQLPGLDGLYHWASTRSDLRCRP